MGLESASLVSVSVLLWLYDLFSWNHPLLLVLPINLEKRGLVKTSHLGISALMSLSHTLHIVQLWVFMLISIYFKKRLLDDH